MKVKSALIGLMAMLAIAPTLSAEALADQARYEEKRAEAIAEGRDPNNPLTAFELAGWLVHDAPAVVYTVKPGLTLSDTPFIRADGTSATLKDYRGRSVLLSYWASWCTVCPLEMPSLNALAGDFEGSRLAVLPVAIADAPEAARAYLNANGLRHIKAHLDPGAVQFQKYGMRGTPSHLVIDPNGEVKLWIEGPLDWNEPALRAYLDGLARS